MIGECSKFRDLLMELAYDELDETSATEVREHAVTCAACRGELESLLLTRKLAATLPEEPVVSGWEQTILDLAADAATGFAAKTVDDRPSDTAFVRDLGLVERRPGFLDQLRTLLLRPVIVTAAAASVVFAVSFFLYENSNPQDLQGERGIEGAPFYGPAASGNGETAKIEPSATGDIAAPAVAQAEAPDRPAPMEPAGSLGTAYDLPRPTAGGGSVTTGGPTPMNSAEKLGDDGTKLARAAKKSADESYPPPQAPPSPEAAIDLNEEAEVEPMPGALTGGWPQASAGKAVEDVVRSPLGDDARSYREGMDAYNRGDCSTASKQLQKVVDPPFDSPDLIPSSLHHLARCEKRSGRCGKALLYYENLLSRYLSYGDRAEAIWEAVGCHRRLGHVERASDLLDELAQIPGWHARAVAEKESLEGPSDK